MIFKTLTATFGQLERETLALHEGLNVIERPNEGGKSTWAAFLLAMLYGIDTTERARQGKVPAKIRYRPWSGQEMAGRMELEWNGRSITVERGPRGRAPLGELRAYETDSGAAVELPGGCGEALLGVERGVYQRSGFIGQRALSLSADGAFEARLRALVSTGDESVDADQAMQHLRDLRNRRRHNNTGTIPQAERLLAQTEDALDELARLGRETMALQARENELSLAREALCRRLSAQKARLWGERQARLEQARQDWERKEKDRRKKAQTVSGLPPEEELEPLLRALEQASGAAHALEEEAGKLGSAPEPPDCPSAFQGLGPDEVRDQAEADAQVLSSLHPPGRASRYLLIVLSVLALGAGAVTLALGSYLPAAAILAVGLLGDALSVLRRRGDLLAARQRAEILTRYDAVDAASIRKAASDYREAVLLYQSRAETHSERRRTLELRQAELATLQAQMLEHTASVCPGARTLGEARDGVQRAIHLRRFYQAAQRETQVAKARYDALLEELNGDVTLPGDYDPAEAVGDPRETATALERLEAELRGLRSELDQHRGRMEGAGDPAALAAQKEALTGRLQRLRREHDALTLAMEALSSAGEELRSRFSPQINALAGEHMARMTGGRYDHVILSRTMDVTAREAGEPESRPLALLSAGTGDQLYLAVRLAICQLLLPRDAPLILDDALAEMDDERMAAAMALLRELSRERQILLFTCHSREMQWLMEH